MGEVGAGSLPLNCSLGLWNPRMGHRAAVSTVWDVSEDSTKVLVDLRVLLPVKVVKNVVQVLEPAENLIFQGRPPQSQV